MNHPPISNNHRHKVRRARAGCQGLLGLLLLPLSLALGSACPPKIPENPTGTIRPDQLPWRVSRLLVYAEQRLGKGRPSDFHRGRWTNALVAMHKALKRKPRQLEVLLLGARVAKELAERSATKGEQFKYANLGRSFSRRGMKVHPKKVAFHYYEAALLGLRVDAFHASAMGAVPDIQAACKRAIALDPSFDHAGPLRVLGSLLVRVPVTAPFHGDVEQGTELLKRAVKLAPDFPLNHYFLAHAYAEDDENELAIKHYRRALCASLGPQWDPIHAKRYRPAARKALVKLKAPNPQCPPPPGLAPPPRR